MKLFKRILGSLYQPTLSITQMPTIRILTHMITIEQAIMVSLNKLTTIKIHSTLIKHISASPKLIKCLKEDNSPAKIYFKCLKFYKENWMSLKSNLL